MSYATPEDYIAYFTERDATGVSAPRGRGVPDGQRITRHLESASNRIDAYIGQRYVLPLRDVPPALRDYCCDIARYLMTGTERPCTDEVRERYGDAIGWLKLVAAGKVGIGSNPESGTVAETGGATTTFFSGGTDLWSRERTGGGCY
ncbi:DUF1320 domain-containing protein [Salmonella enterica]|nr:DUF1320 domain-containing protein [Salmonella enterica]ELN0443668.1 DUF1320 domain-containing protein [Salmonella enterica]